jgi:hypothetical protein
MKVPAQYLQIKNPAAVKVRLQDPPGPRKGAIPQPIHVSKHAKAKRKPKNGEGER